MRATASLAGKLERNLLAYVTAASAAGVAALAQPAEAKVIYTPDLIVLEIGESYHLDVDHDGVIDLTLIRTRHSLSGGGYSSELFVRSFPGGGSVAAGRRGPNGHNALALQHGDPIDSNRRFANRANLAYLKVSSSGRQFRSGYWINVKDGYLGLRFSIESEAHFGWTRLTVHLGKGKTTLTGYAYETIPDKPIIAGNRGSTTGQGPEAEPVSLGRLALGAAGRKQHQPSRAYSH